MNQEELEYLVKREGKPIIWLVWSYKSNPRWKFSTHSTFEIGLCLRLVTHKEERAENVAEHIRESERGHGTWVEKREMEHFFGHEDVLHMLNLDPRGKSGKQDNVKGKT